jgi:hypothetical protein
MAWKITVQAARKHTGKPQDRFIMADGLKIARRGYPGTSEEGTWVELSRALLNFTKRALP